MSRRNARPFGGIQLLVTGDFFQLPPVNDNKASRAAGDSSNASGTPAGRRYAFDADSWHGCFGRQIVLQRVFRQSDNEFVSLLNEVREGRVSESSLERLRSRQVGREGGEAVLSAAHQDNVLLTTLYPYKVGCKERGRASVNQD